MRSAVLLFAGFAAATPSAQLLSLSIPIAIIPTFLPALALGAGNSNNALQNLTNTLNSTRQILNIYNGQIASANTQFSTNVTTNIDPVATLTTALAGISNTLWSSAYDLEKQICSTASSINQQYVTAQKNALVTATTGQAQALLNVKTGIQNTVAQVTKLSRGFTKAEKAAMLAAIKAIAESAGASVTPVKAFATGLQSAGVTGFASAVNNLAAAASGVASVGSAVQLPGS